MTVEFLFYTQIISILGYIGTGFLLYRLLVAQKDAVIELLKERNKILQEKITELETQSSDVLIESLARRVDVAKAEITELNKDAVKNKEEIDRKEGELIEFKESLDRLTSLLSDSDLICPSCQAPLTRRGSHTIYGEIGGREIEADIEFSEYACGYTISEDRAEPISKCKFSNKS
jgi:hypothetical protein